MAMSKCFAITDLANMCFLVLISTTSRSQFAFISKETQYIFMRLPMVYVNSFNITHNLWRQGINYIISTFLQGYRYVIKLMTFFSKEFSFFQEAPTPPIASYLDNTDITAWLVFRRSRELDSWGRMVKEGSRDALGRSPQERRLQEGGASKASV